MKWHFTERRRRGSGTLHGYSCRLPKTNYEVYSRRTKGQATTVGVRVSYPSEGYSRKVAVIDLPDGVDERVALRRLADFVARPWVERVVLGEIDGKCSCQGH